MTRAKRAAELIRLGWLAHYGRLCVGSDNPDVAIILEATNHHIIEVPLDPAAPWPHSARLRMACELFASAAFSEAARLGGMT